MELTERDEIDDLARLRQTFQHLRAVRPAPGGRRRRRRQRRPAPALAGPVRHRQARPLARPGRRAPHGRSSRPAVAPRPGPRPARPRRGRGRRDGRSSCSVLRELQIGAGPGLPAGPPGRLGGGHLRGRRPPRRRAPRGRGQPRSRRGRDRPAALVNAAAGRAEPPMADGSRQGRPRRWATTCAPSSCPALALARPGRTVARPPPEPPRALRRRSGRVLGRSGSRSRCPRAGRAAGRPIARPSAMTARSAREPGPSARSAERTLGTMPPAMTPSAMSRSASSGRQLARCAAPSAPRTPSVSVRSTSSPPRAALTAAAASSALTLQMRPSGSRPMGASTGSRPAASSAWSSDGVRHRLGDDEAEPAARVAADGAPSMPRTPDGVGAQVAAAPRSARR